MIEIDLLRDLGVILFAATGMVLVTRLVHIPSIVAYILAGLLIGPALGLIEVSHTVELISEVGIALLLFIVGLELSLEKIRDVGRVAVAAGLGQVVFTAAGGFGLCLLLGFTAVESIFIATALTFSSTVVVVKLLDQKRELDAVYGRIAVGIFLVQDLVVIVALTFLAGLGTTDDLTGAEMAVGVAKAFGGMSIILAVAFGAARWVLPTLFGWVARSPESRFVWALAWCFALVMGAEFLELSLEIGAFLAGMALAQLPYEGDLRRRIHPLMNFFIAVFFVTLGVQMQFDAARTMAWPAMILSLFVLIGNPFIFLWIIARMGYGERTAFLTSVTVAQISEFSFILAAMGFSSGLIGEEILSLIGIVGLVTIGVSAYMILHNHRLYAFLEKHRLLRLFGAASEGKEVLMRDQDEGANDHVIVVGMNSLGRALVEGLVERGVPTVAIDTDPEKLADLPCRTILGNAEYLSLLEEAGIHRARLLVSALQIENTNLLLALRASVFEIPAVIHTFDQSLVEELERLGVAHILDSRTSGVERMTTVLKEEGVFGG
jgi:Kef-type K+ transport system membrane component KefB